MSEATATATATVTPVSEAIATATVTPVVNYAARVKELYPEASKLNNVFTSNPACTPDILEKKIFPCLKFRNYIENFNHEIRDLRSIEILGVFMFGPNVGFIYINCGIYIPGTNTKEVSGFVFIRGDAIAVLVIASVHDKRYALLTRQWRSAGGDNKTEALAGMCDENGDPTGVAIKELYEESGIRLTKKDLIPVGTMEPSIGGCDERITCFYTTTVDLAEDRFDTILSKTHGVDGEKIRIIAKPMDTEVQCIDLALETGDSKLATCMMGYIKNTYHAPASVVAPITTMV